MLENWESLIDEALPLPNKGLRQPGKRPDPLAFLAGPGEMAGLLRGWDWGATSLGPPAGWPQPLRTAVRLMLNTRHPIVLFWGAEHLCLYNDAYRVSIGDERHPSALGRPGRDVWAEIWDTIGPQLALVMSGGAAAWHENQLLPIDDADAPGGVGGALVLVTETTAQVMSSRGEVQTAAIRAAERDQLSRLFAQAPGFMAMLHGPEHRFEMVNPAYSRLIGGRDVVGRTVGQVLPEAAAQSYVAMLDSVYATGRAITMTGARFAIQETPGGPIDERFVDFVCQPVTGEEDTVAGVFLQGVDVTERVRGEEARLQTADLLSAIVENAPGLIYAKDPDGRMVLANHGVSELIGRPWQEVEGRTDLEFLSDRDEAYAIMRNDRRIMQSGQAEELEEEVSRVAGQPRHYLSRKAPMRNAAGNVIGLVGMSVDITPRKALERELQVLNATLEARVAERTAERDRTWQNSQDLLCVVDAEGIFQAVNPAFTKILGWEAAEIIGQNHLSFSHPDQTERATAARLRALSGQMPSFETRFLAKDGSYRWVAWVATGENGLAYASGRHITAEREAAETLARTEELLRQSQKMQAVGQLTGGIAHDFNNMLQSIASGVELMQRRIAAGRTEEASKFLEITRQSVDRAAALTNRLLAFSRKQSLAPSRVELGFLLPDICSLIHQAAGPSIEVKLAVHSDCWPVRCDPNQLENALLNLAINARDAMLPDGGDLVVKTANVALSRADLAGWEEAAPGNFVHIAVSDSGTGMTQDVMARAFEPFFTTKETGQGTGLGLSQVFGFARQSNGMVKLASVPGQGTTVSIYLARDTAEAAPAPAPAPPQARPSITAVILLVEDEPDIRAFAAASLRELGATVIEARDGASALAALQAASQGQVDMLITDVGLPGGMNGYRLADAVREQHPLLPVLLISGSAGDSGADETAAAPGVALLTKPFTLDELAARVSEAGF